jgi:hypothetical protein
MKERNRHSLQQAIGQLPEYSPPDDLWDAMETALDMERELRDSLHALPQYEPPARIWQNLDAALEHVPSGFSPRLFIIRQSRSLLAVAATVALLLSVWQYFDRNPGATEYVVVKQEQLNEQLRALVEKDDDEAFSLIQSLCQSRAPVCEEAAFKALKSELDELTDAKNALRQNLGRYGDDPGLAAQIIHIERERSGVLRQLMSLI